MLEKASSIYTTKYGKSISEEMLEHDVIIKMPPKKKYWIKAKITNIRKAEPKVIIPDSHHSET